ncbi:hypothetical protein GSF22_18605 [Micromonospora echinofusca]|uniref:RNA polymerase sigma factor, sigma-70 family n=1 Tax=Micromonospora echinofusca TaxID=47858 RepID=A0ABS3VTZ9_MICEH|nr:hypothetical protein [Micromonospora echinofusca]
MSSGTGVEDLLRELAPQVLGALVRRYGQFDACEDAVQEALLRAAERWPADGPPDNPRGWLITVASHRFLDEVRGDQARQRREYATFVATPQAELLGRPADADPVVDRDDSLALLFLCCHPALSPSSRIALTLRAVGGLGTAQIAAAFLVPEATMAQRISRAKQSIRTSGDRFAPPEAADRTERLRAVRHVLYLMFNEGYTASTGPDLTVPQLSREAIRLTTWLRRLLPDDSEVTGLLALMLLTEARRPARTGPDGALVPLAEQDRTRWDRRLVATGTDLVAEALTRGPVGPYQLQAAIAALHDEAASVATTDWPQILALYELLEKVAPGPVVTLNRAVAVAMVHGPAAGLDLLETLAADRRPGTGLGVLERVVGFAAATQGTPTPAPWGTVRVLLLHGDHTGGAAAGTVPGESTRRADQARAGVGPLARLAAESGAGLQVVDAPTAAPIEEGPALTAEAVESALRYGWRLADEAADAGVQLLVIGACGAGAETAAAAVLAATAGAEAPAVLARVVNPGGHVDDNAWMVRCAAVRDSLRRIRSSSRTAKEILAELGGGDITVATGVLLGAAARRLPVLLDGPVGLAAGLVSRDLAGQARHWCLLPDHGGHPAVSLAADVLGLTPLLDLRLGLGEGANALAALPLLRSVLALAAALPAHPALAGPEPDAPDDGSDGHPPAGEDEPDFTEPEPAGPGPTSTGPDRPTGTGPDTDGSDDPAGRGSTGIDPIDRAGVDGASAAWRAG